MSKDNYDILCGGCEHYFNPQKNVLCNFKGSCRRLALATINETPDNYTPKKKEDNNDTM